MKLIIVAGVLAFALAGCGSKQTSSLTSIGVERQSDIEQTAHGAYVDAINSNDADKLAGMLTDDVVYQFPGAPELVGKPAVTAWIREYFDAYETRWEKTSIGFAANGDLAVERYTYKSTDTDRKTGAVTTDAGKGINVFRRGEDGKWRVSVDGWSSDQPAS